VFLWSWVGVAGLAFGKQKTPGLEGTGVQANTDMSVFAYRRRRRPLEKLIKTQRTRTSRAVVHILRPSSEWYLTRPQ
jgi:hypothetical protein